jgi:hypothetical protein
LDVLNVSHGYEFSLEELYLDNGVSGTPINICYVVSDIFRNSIKQRV